VVITMNWVSRDMSRTRRTKPLGLGSTLEESTRPAKIE